MTAKYEFSESFPLCVLVNKINIEPTRVNDDILQKAIELTKINQDESFDLIVESLLEEGQSYYKNFCIGDISITKDFSLEDSAYLIYVSIIDEIRKVNKENLKEIINIEYNRENFKVSIDINQNEKGILGNGDVFILKDKIYFCINDMVTEIKNDKIKKILKEV